MGTKKNLSIMQEIWYLAGLGKGSLDLTEELYCVCFQKSVTDS